MEHYNENGDSEWACGGDDDCEAVEREPDCIEGEEHEWTSEGEGGCDENPGVWSLGGTIMSFAAHCTVCSVRRVETHYGYQRNPGQCDEVRYEDAHECERNDRGLP